MIVFHIDFDYFYAQCEEVRQPRLKTCPVCVCVFSDRGADSGAVATANYTARGFGAKSGMSIATAKRLLAGRDDAVFLPVDFEYYDQMSQGAMSIMERHADVFEYVGRDEAYLDVTDRTGSDYTSAGHLAQQVKNAIREQTKLGCSIGVSPNKLVSKIASDYQKPDGLTIVTPDRIPEFLEPLKIRDIPGIGRKTEEWFAGMNIQTVGDLRKLDVFALNKEFGRKTGTHMYNAARGIYDVQVQERKPSIQYSKIMTLQHDSRDYGFLSKGVAELCGQVCEIVKKNNVQFKSVGIHFVQSDLSNRSKSRMLKNPTSGLEELQRAAQQLLGEALEDQAMPVRRLGVRVSELSDIRGQSSITNYF